MDTAKQNELLDFLTGLSPSAFNRVAAHFPEAEGQFAKAATPQQRATALIRYALSTAGPGIESLAAAVANLFPGNYSWTPDSPSTGRRGDDLPPLPQFHAVPSYLASPTFVGRQAQLDALDNWASSSDTYPILLFEAIGGAGKSMLTWHWATRRAPAIRPDLAGIFWYSFYERGALLADFCRHALAYITGRPRDEFQKLNTSASGRQLVAALRERPFLLVLDGLERVLVAYHRMDAAQVADEAIDTSGDPIAQRDPCAAIRPEDDDLLRLLATVSPSKILITTRLMPAALLDSSDRNTPGVLRVGLPGLLPSDAEALLHSCDIHGDSTAIQDFLQRHCDCHPLIIGVLAGLIRNYPPDPGNFDTWVTDSVLGGGQLNLSDLDPAQKRNHILRAAFAALPETSGELLATLALLSEAADYPTLCAINPHLPPRPEPSRMPVDPEKTQPWKAASDVEKERMLLEYQVTQERWQAHCLAWTDWYQTIDSPTMKAKLSESLRDLEHRGLLRCDPLLHRYDLHPVIHGVAVGHLTPAERDRLGQRAIDYFYQQKQIPYETVNSLEDLRNSLNIVRIFQMRGRFQDAYNYSLSSLGGALVFILEAYAEALALYRPFFPNGWGVLPGEIGARAALELARNTSTALGHLRMWDESLAAAEAIIPEALRLRNWSMLLNALVSVALARRHSATTERLMRLSIEIADLSGDIEEQYRTRANLLMTVAGWGRYSEAESLWQSLQEMERSQTRPFRAADYAHYSYAHFQFLQGNLTEEALARAEQLAHERNRHVFIRDLHALRGRWYVEQGQWSQAIVPLEAAVQMSHEVGQTAKGSEVHLCLARYQLGDLPDPVAEAERLAAAGYDDDALATLWLTIGDQAQATKHALASYKWAWADGEPYMNRYYLDRYYLDRARTLLKELGEAIPELLPYDPAQDNPFPWEAEIRDWLGH